MIIFLYGPDTYRSRQKLNEIVRHYRKIHQSGLNLKYFDEKDLDFEEIEREIQQVSIMAGKKMLILRNIFFRPEFKKKFLKNCKSFINSKDLILFYEEKELSENEPFFKLLKKSGSSQEFKLLDGQNLKNWIKKEFDTYYIKTTPEVIDKLINFVGNDSWQLANEIKKLANYRKDKTIGVRDVEVLVKPKIDADIFKTIDAMAQKNKRQALGLLHKHLEKGDSPLYLLSMVNFQFRNLIEIKSLTEKNYTYQSILKRTKLHPYIVKKSLWQAKKFSSAELKKIYQRIFKVDMNIKTGKLNPEIALDLLISEI